MRVVKPENELTLNQQQLGLGSLSKIAFAGEECVHINRLSGA